MASPSQNSADVVMEQLDWDKQMDKLLNSICSYSTDGNSVKVKVS